MKLNKGDIFTIELNDAEVGFGQIIALPTKSTLIIALFDLKLPKAGNYDIEIVAASEVLFLGYSLDAKLYHKNWVIIGNLEPRSDILLPYCKLGTPPGAIYITDFKGKRLRECTVEEFNLLSYQTVIAPVRYENALKAFYRFREWIDDDYNKILYKHTQVSNEIYQSNSFI
jgi:hypothetical protein